jgi:hypothetical protein
VAYATYIERISLCAFVKRYFFLSFHREESKLISFAWANFLVTLIYFHLVIFPTQRCAWVVNTLASYSEDPRFKSRVGNRLPFWEFSWLSSVSSDKCWDNAVNTMIYFSMVVTCRLPAEISWLAKSVCTEQPKYVTVLYGVYLTFFPEESWCYLQGYFPPKIIDAGILLNSLIVHQALLLHA